MKFLFTLAFFFLFSSSFSQWTRVQQLPSSDIFSLYHKDSALYAGGENIIYISRDKGQTWDSTSFIPQLSFVDNIIVYKNELYASSYSNGVYKSPDQGVTWKNITSGLFPFVSDLCEFRGNLYAATLGDAVYKLDSVNRNNWAPFQTGLSSLSANISSIAATNNALIAGTTANALYDYLPSNSTVWEEKFLLNQLHPSEGAYDIVTGHDTLFFSGHTGKFYISIDNGQNWKIFGNTLVSNNTTLVNARQALLSSRSNFDGLIYTTSFDYIKKDSLQFPFIPFSSVQDHFTYKIDIVGKKLWDASNRGLFYMSLSDLPGISSADDTVSNITLPVLFTFLNTTCEQDKIRINWGTAQEQNSSHFDVEESSDGNSWSVIGTQPASGNSNIETSYSFIKENTTQNNLYRIAEYDLDGHVHYSEITRSSCSSSSTDIIKLWPNPIRDKVFINIISGNESQANIKVFDSKGALIKVQKTTIVQGSNQLSVDLSSAANGLFWLQIDWNNGKMRDTFPVMKQ